LGFVPSPLPLGSWARRTRGGVAVLPRLELDGRSFGVSFLFSQASMLTQAIPRADTIASVALDADGQIDAVTGLEAKIETVVSVAPSIRRFLVHHTQELHGRALAA